MNIEIKKSIKTVKYNIALNQMEKRLEELHNKNNRELIWLLEHEEVYTGGTSYKENEILDKKINFIKTNRGGKITYHGPGQLVCYFVIDLKKRGKNIRKLITNIEDSIIKTLMEFKIRTFPDRENIGIWFRDKNKSKKVAAIGIKVKKWIAYHGFAININNDLKKYDKIIPCGIKNKKVTNLISIKKQNYNLIKNILIKKFLFNLQN